MAEDEPGRDARRQLSAAGAGSRELRSVASEPHAAEELRLHPELGHARDAAQPGAFRSEPALVWGNSERCTDSFLAGLTDPRARFLLRPSQAQAEEQRELPRPSGGSSNLVTVLVILKSTVGGTLIVIPGGFAGAGFAMATALLVVLGAIEIYCMVILVRCSQALGGASYGEVARQAVGPVGSAAVDVSLVLSQFGFVCAEMLYAAKNCNRAMVALGWHDAFSVVSILLLQLILEVPMAWLRKLEYFKVSNAVANATVLAALAALLGFAVSRLCQEGPGPGLELLVGPRWVLFAGTAVFSFECINFVIPMYEAHEQKDTFVPILVGTLIGIIVLFVVFGGVNYLSYGSGTESVVTLNLPQESVVGQVLPLAFALASLCNVPLFLFPATTLIEEKAFDAARPRSLQRTWAKNGLRTLFVLLCTAISWAGADSIEALVALIGSVCCVPLAFIYPVVFHSRLCRPGLIWTVLDCAIGLLGATLLVSTTVAAIQHF